MHKTQETAKESRLNFMYSHLRNRTLAPLKHSTLAPPLGSPWPPVFLRARLQLQDAHRQVDLNQRQGRPLDRRVEETWGGKRDLTKSHPPALLPAALKKSGRQQRSGLLLGVAIASHSQCFRPV